MGSAARFGSRANGSGCTPVDDPSEAMDAHGNVTPGPGFDRRRAGPAGPAGAPAVAPGALSRRKLVARLGRGGLAAGRVLAVAPDAAPLVHALEDAGYEANGLDHAPELGAAKLAEWHTDPEDGAAIPGETPEVGPWPVRIGDVGVHIPWPTATFDAVVLLDVLDRVADDVGAALEVKRVLRPGGHVLIEGPNAGGLLARALGTRWAIRRDPRVMRLYDVPALVALFGYQGFRMRAWGTHFDLYRAGGSTPVFAPLRRIGGVWPGCGAGERAVLLAQKPLLDLPAWNQRRP